jgi:hypothetical protein
MPFRSRRQARYFHWAEEHPQEAKKRGLKPDVVSEYITAQHGKSLKGLPESKAEGGSADDPSHLTEANEALSLTQQERNLYAAHLRNLWLHGPIQQPGGARSTLLQMSDEVNGRTRNYPGVWEGKFTPEQAADRADAYGPGYWPEYESEPAAEARYGQMHDYMAKDLDVPPPAPTAHHRQGGKVRQPKSVYPAKTRW